ncbi:unnamed protein product, partial [Acidithrix sp. C25]
VNDSRHSKVPLQQAANALGNFSIYCHPQLVGSIKAFP